MIPKNKNLWVFGAWKGRNYSDNAKELFEYVSENQKDIRAVWIAKNQIVYDQVKAKGYNVVMYPSKEAKKIVTRAGVNIQTESNEDTGRYRVSGTIIVQLFHGYGGVKEPRLYAGMSELKKKIVKIYADDHSKSYWMVPSVYFCGLLPNIYETDKNKMSITGQPRIDLLLRRAKIEYFEDFIKTHEIEKMLLYVPTHRNYGQNEGIDISYEEWQRLNNYLAAKKYYLLFKPHPLELYKYENFKGFSNIIIVTQIPNSSDVYEYIHYFDALISDYSSIATDYLVLDRPIIHYMYDLDTFSTESMFVDDDNKFICGPICKTQDDLIAALEDCFVNDRYRVKRVEVRSRAYKYID